MDNRTPLTHPAYHDGLEPDEGLTTTGLERAADLVFNFLHNEDGESDEWLEEAHDIIRAHLRGERRERVDPDLLAQAMGVNNIWAHMGSTNPDTQRRVAGNVAAEYNRLAGDRDGLLDTSYHSRRRARRLADHTVVGEERGDAVANVWKNAAKHAHRATPRPR